MNKQLQQFNDDKPTLRFSPSAWAKLIFFRDIGDTEIGGFGITSADDLLYVHQFAVITQRVTTVSVKFDDNAVADFFDDQVDIGSKPEQFSRIWLHTHPADSPEPSMVDEETFERVFGQCDWAVMCIIAQDDSIYARLRFAAGPGGQILIPVTVDFAQPFEAADHQAWHKEYKDKVILDKPIAITCSADIEDDDFDDEFDEFWWK